MTLRNHEIKIRIATTCTSKTSINGTMTGYPTRGSNPQPYASKSQTSGKIKTIMPKTNTPTMTPTTA